MARKQTLQNEWLQLTVLRLSRLHFYLVGAYAGSIIVFDSWNLITADAVKQRWAAATVLLIVTTLAWYASRFSLKPVYYQLMAYALVVVDVLIAGYLVYIERGMASRAVALFVIPILVAAVLRKRSALIATAALCTASYSFAAVKYYTEHYGEGFKIELYGVVGFYCALFFIVAGILNILISQSNHS